MPAHGGETILLAKAGKPWARLMPLASEAPPEGCRTPAPPGPLCDPEALLEPITADELAQWEATPLLPLGSPLAEAE